MRFVRRAKDLEPIDRESALRLCRCQSYRSYHDDRLASVCLTPSFRCTHRRLLKVMGSLNGEERCMIPLRYKEIYDKDLRDVMKKECGNSDFGTALQLLAVPPPQADCALIDKACKGIGTNELLLFTIICGRSNRDMEILKVGRWKKCGKRATMVSNDSLLTRRVLYYECFLCYTYVEKVL